MRVHVVKMGVLSVLVAAVAAQSTPLHVLTAAAPASNTSPVPGSPVAVLTPADATTATLVPDAWSFDDAHGAVTWTGAAAPSSTVAPRRPAAPRTPPKPPAGAAATGALPTAGTPQAVLAAAYVKAAARAPRSCHLEVAHLAAIGQVESGSVGGRRIDAAHRVSPAIYGPLLDGGPFAVVRDSDRGAHDGASDYDRAMGPLQFLPGTWSWAGRDGDGDGRRDPQNVFDAALATADYLCRDGRDLSRAGDRRAAILSYNWSGEYVAAVSQWISYFTRHGLAPLDDVAFRVGSGGRASALAIARSAEDIAADTAAKKAAKKARGQGEEGCEEARPGGEGEGSEAPHPGVHADPRTDRLDHGDSGALPDDHPAAAGDPDPQPHPDPVWPEPGPHPVRPEPVPDRTCPRVDDHTTGRPRRPRPLRRPRGP